MKNTRFNFFVCFEYDNSIKNSHYNQPILVLERFSSNREATGVDPVDFCPITAVLCKKVDCTGLGRLLSQCFAHVVC